MQGYRMKNWMYSLRGRGQIRMPPCCLSRRHIEHRENYVYPWRCLLEKGERFSAEELRDRVNDGPCKRYERMEEKRMDEKNYMMGLYQQRPRVGIEMSGVLSYTEDCLRCNSQNIIKMVMDGVEKLKPKKDWNEGFAGRVVVTVELLGDLEGDKA